MWEEAHRIAAAKRLRKPTAAIYVEVIEIIEQKLDEPGQ
jgi:hypothetical protein